MTDPETYTFVISSAGPCDVPLQCRVRKFLKCALRQYKLKASWPRTPATNGPSADRNIDPTSKNAPACGVGGKRNE